MIIKYLYLIIAYSTYLNGSLTIDCYYHKLINFKEPYIMLNGNVRTFLSHERIFIPKDLTTLQKLQYIESSFSQTNESLVRVMIVSKRGEEWKKIKQPTHHDLIASQTDGLVKLIAVFTPLDPYIPYFW